MFRFVTIALILAVLKSLESSPLTTKDRTLFFEVCGTANINEILFRGACDLAKPHPKLVEIVKFINSSNSDLTIDDFLRNYLFKNSSFFFENKYKDNSTYLDTFKGYFNVYPSK